MMLAQNILRDSSRPSPVIPDAALAAIWNS